MPQRYGYMSIPASLNTSAHNEWVKIVKKAEALAYEDRELQVKAAKFLRLKERNLPPEVLGRSYAQYCDLINRMYDAYLNSVHLQRAPYILEIVSVFMKRLYELRNELVLLITNDYIYIDRALAQLTKTPYDIQIVVPYHIPMESRPNTMEQMLQTMWKEAVIRKNTPKVAPKSTMMMGSDEDILLEPSIEEVPPTPEESVHTIVSEDFIQACIIQKQERFRANFREQCIKRRTFFAAQVKEPPKRLKIKAAAIIQLVHRAFMKIKRKQLLDSRRDVILGLVPDPFKKRLNFEEENVKIYERRRKTRKMLEEAYKKEIERENTKLILLKDGQIEDISEHVREWFMEWYKGYGFFPQFPYELEGGTMMVLNGTYPSIEEKIEEDEKIKAATKGKTKDQLKEEKAQALLDAELKAELDKEAKKKEAETLLKIRCNPMSDPGYKVHRSDVIDHVIDVLQKYRGAWSLYDQYPADTCAETIYGYMKPVLTEDLMSQIHKDCRIYVDELMRLDLKLLVKMQQAMWKRVEWKYPKQTPRKRPKAPKIPKVLNVDSKVLESLEQIFDLGMISKPTSRIKDIIGDLNYAAYEFNIRDPDATFPPPAYGDIRRRLLMSCIFASGLQPEAARNKSVMLCGPPRNGKSFLVDCVAGEMNAVKIDISPQMLSTVSRPGKILSLAFLAAKVFQPAVLYCRDIEKVFAKKVLPEDKHLKAKKLKKPLKTLLKAIAVDDKVIFIATCTFPTTATVRPMMSFFSEMILVPRLDYGTIQLFFYHHLQSIRSVPRDYCVQALAHLLQGFGSGLVLELFHDVMTSERIVKLNDVPLSPAEFLEPLIENEIEPVTLQDYQQYTEFYIKNSPLKKVKEDYKFINTHREAVYQSIAKKEAAAAEKEK